MLCATFSSHPRSQSIAFSYQFVDHVSAVAQRKEAISIMKLFGMLFLPIQIFSQKKRTELIEFAYFSEAHGRIKKTEVISLIAMTSNQYTFQWCFFSSQCDKKASLRMAISVRVCEFETLDCSHQ